MKYNTEFICDMVCRMCVALKSPNKFTEDEEKQILMTVYALDSDAGNDMMEYLEKKEE